ncbi:head-tail adaptor protein [Sphingobium sp. PNB]|uniref:head-tail adaptor protein n=1 Tax=Sphingobium sp. PNB TaxID=863934 RepID=UPI001CA3B51A|nr:head-tail adaptor protein [Sphingobium sp. PNB]MCB4861970.1 head-tail adaptor protein [Sphingobium sp. PNB]
MAWAAPGAGQLRDLLTIRRKSQISDGMGGFRSQWDDVLTNIPARITATRGGEAVNAQRLNGHQPFEITVRLCADTQTITSADIAVNARTGTTYNIKWISSLEEGRKSFLLILAQAGEVSVG